MKTIARLILMFALTSSVFAGDNSRESQVDDIREVVLRYQFDHNVSAQQKTTKILFIEVGTDEKNKDPSDEMMKRFAEHKPTVRVGSAAHFVRGKGVLDMKTGEEGLIIFVSYIKWISDTKVEVIGGDYEGPLSATINTYTVEKNNGKWKVTKCQLKGAA